jgi:hypothetical protein
MKNRKISFLVLQSSRKGKEKKMEKRKDGKAVLAAMLVVFAFVLASCSKESLVGTWVNANPGTNQYPDKYEIMKDGKAKVYIQGQTLQLVWKTEDDRLKMAFEEYPTVEVVDYRFELVKKQLTVELPEMGIGYFNRQKPEKSSEGKIIKADKDEPLVGTWVKNENKGDYYPNRMEISKNGKVTLYDDKGEKGPDVIWKTEGNRLRIYANEAEVKDNEPFLDFRYRFELGELCIDVRGGANQWYKRLEK